MKERYLLEISKTPDDYRACIHRGDPRLGHDLGSAALGPEVKLAGDEWHTLGSLVAELATLRKDFYEHVFNERLQLLFGQHLYAQTFGQLDHGEPATGAEAELQIITGDEHAAHLPWVLLARQGRFLCASGWTVALTRPGLEQAPCELPPSPRMLVAMPQPADLPPTAAQAHFEDLEELLRAADHLFQEGKHLCLVTTWEDFRERLNDFQPHILYFYGHGEGTLATSRLLFAGGKGNQRHEVPIVDLAQCLRRATGGPPLLAYVNCCGGDTGGLLGAGWQLGDLVPAVVTNRTTAFIPAARAQAMELWRAVLLDGTAPDAAVAGMYARVGEAGLSFRDARWMTPVLHRHYGTWRSHPPKPRSRLERDPHWRVKLDRVQQFGQVVLQTREMLQERKPRVLAFLWYGEEGQGVGLFAERLKVQLREHLTPGHDFEVCPEWPDQVEVDPYGSFEDRIFEALGVQSIDDVPARIRGETRGARGSDTVLYVRHHPLRRGEVVDPGVLKIYLEWWNDVFAPLLGRANAFGLLGVSFVVRDPGRFIRMLNKHLGSPELSDVVFHPLEHFKRLTRKDLTDFLRSHNVVLPRHLKDKVLDRILEQTGGQYELTLRALYDVVNRAWDLESEEVPEPAADEEEGDW